MIFAARIGQLANTIALRIGYTVGQVVRKSKSHQFMPVESMMVGAGTGRAVLTSMRARVMPEHGLVASVAKVDVGEEVGEEGKSRVASRTSLDLMVAGCQ